MPKVNKKFYEKKVKKKANKNSSNMSKNYKIKQTGRD